MRKPLKVIQAGWWLDDICDLEGLVWPYWGEKRVEGEHLGANRPIRRLLPSSRWEMMVTLSREVSVGVKKYRRTGKRTIKKWDILIHDRVNTQPLCHFTKNYPQGFGKSSCHT